MSPPVTSLPNVAGAAPPQIDEDRVAMSNEALKHAIINLVGNARCGQHTGGSNVLPSRQFQFAITYRF